jgi:hypothetical protein
MFAIWLCFLCVNQGGGLYRFTEIVTGDVDVIPPNASIRAGRGKGEGTGCRSNSRV